MEKNQKIIIILFFIFLVFFLLSSFFLNLNKEKNSKSNLKNNLEEKNNISTVNFYKSKINLISEKQIYNLNDLIKVNIFADVPKENITAYDLILNYDQNNLEFIKAESIFSEFQVFVNNNNNNVFLTIAKVSQDQNKIIFNNQKILSIYFKPKNQKETFVKIKKKLDNYSTKFVNEKTEIIYPEVNQIKINVQ